MSDVAVVTDNLSERHSNYKYHFRAHIQTNYYVCICVHIDSHVYIERVVVHIQVTL